ncbi:MAG: hypothetical protein ABJN04_06915 [Hyphomicrobiales bacterium]
MEFKLKTSETKPLSYALNRARRCFKKKGETKLIALIREGKIQVRAEKVSAKEAEKCFVFPLTQLDYAPKNPHFQMAPADAERIKAEFEQEDRIAYEIAYSLDRTTQQDDDFVTFRGSNTIFVWRGLQEAETLYDSVINFSDYNVFDDLGEYTVDLDFTANFNSVRYLSFHELPKIYMKFSRYRSDCHMSIVQASGLTCLKSQVEEYFPHSDKYGSRKANRPPIIDTADLYRYLDKQFNFDPSQAMRRGVLAKAIWLYIEEKEILAEKGGPSKSTIDNYRKDYLAYLAEKPKK